MMTTLARFASRSTQAFPVETGTSSWRTYLDMADQTELSSIEKDMKFARKVNVGVTLLTGGALIYAGMPIFALFAAAGMSGALGLGHAAFKREENKSFLSDRAADLEVDGKAAQHKAVTGRDLPAEEQNKMFKQARNRRLFNPWSTN